MKVVDSDFRRAVELGQEAFWEAVRGAFRKEGAVAPSSAALAALGKAAEAAVAQWAAVNLPPPDGAEVGFEFEGTWITHPFQSECGRFHVDPRYYGFTEIMLADTSEVLGLVLPGGQRILLTDLDGVRAPMRGDESARMVLVDAGGKEIGVAVLEEVTWPAPEVTPDQPRPRQVARLALEFARVLELWLSEAELTEVRARNEAEKEAGICHSHDFCDANMAMHDAFLRVGAVPPASLAEDCPDDEQDRVTGLWNDAWDAAKAAGFSSDALEAAYRTGAKPAGPGLM